MSDNIPRLTGGILFGLILEARNPRTRVRSREVDKNDGLTEVDIMLSLLEIFIGESQPRPQGTTFKKNVSDYKNVLPLLQLICHLIIKHLLILSEIPSNKIKKTN
ncbi:MULTISPECIES: hypothetical protein [Streptococcus]|uniref:hypothetical protein n=1 Tax=Streptococcus TaxID=1301 RepID=UPI001D167AD9|nr:MULTISPECIES: hypothetical protein [Streptococcus]